jgi:uncharacterized lipoprotein YddW (UPF0748 family)
MKISLARLILLVILMAVVLNIHTYAAAPEPMRGVWLWGSTVREMGKDGVVTVIDDLRNSGFTDIFLLVKGESGVVGYPSRVALSTVKTEGDLLKAIIAEAHKSRMKVHAWFVVNGDAAWTAKHPEDMMVHLKNGPTSGRVSPLAPNYQKYIKDLIREIIDNYDIDGVHLDYIRYSHAVYSFDKYVLDAAKNRGIDVNQVKNILNQTFYNPKDGSIVIRAYQSGDPAIVAWEKLRRDIITGFAQNIKEVVKSAQHPLPFSAALMPEGSYDPTFADVYYAQNYKDAGALYDFVTPMAYWKDFSKPPQWVGATVVKQGAAALGKTPVMAGLQAYDVPGNKQLEAAEEAAMTNGAGGVVYFRYGSFAFASMQVRDVDGKTLVSLEVRNRTGSAIDNIEIDFKGTGLNPKSVMEVPTRVAPQVNGTKVSLEGDQLLGSNKSIVITVVSEKDLAKAVSVTPAINLSLQKRVFVPVCAVIK